MNRRFVPVNRVEHRSHWYLRAWTQLAFVVLALAMVTQLTQAHAQTDGNDDGSPPGSILILGDSLSAEYGLERGRGWVALLERRIEQNQYATRVINASVSGETTSGGAGRIDALLANHQPDLVIIELGGNDGLRGLPLNLTRDNLVRMVQASQQAGAEVILVGMQIPPNYGAAYARRFAEIFGQIAEAEGVDLVPFLLEGIATNEQYFQSDRIHPTAEAQPYLLENVWPVLEPYLRAEATDAIGDDIKG